MKSILSAILLLLLPLLSQAVPQSADTISSGTRVYQAKVIEDNPRVYQAKVIEAETIIECDNPPKGPKPLRPVFAAYTLGVG